MSVPLLSLGCEGVFGTWHERQTGMDPASGKYLQDQTWEWNHVLLVQFETLNQLISKDASFGSYQGGFQVGVYTDQGEQRGEQMEGKVWRVGPSPTLAFSPPSKEWPQLYPLHGRILCKVTFKERFLNENKWIR